MRRTDPPATARSTSAPPSLALTLLLVLFLAMVAVALQYAAGIGSASAPEFLVWLLLLGRYGQPIHRGTARFVGAIRRRLPAARPPSRSRYIEREPYLGCE